jgi:hypothetical protein
MSGRGILLEQQHIIIMVIIQVKIIVPRLTIDIVKKNFTSTIILVAPFICGKN